MRGENFVAHLDGLGGTPVAHHWSNPMEHSWKILNSCCSLLKQCCEQLLVSSIIKNQYTSIPVAFRSIVHPELLQEEMCIIIKIKKLGYTE
jgi:hypothetical protein